MMIKFKSYNSHQDNDYDVDDDVDAVGDDDDATSVEDDDDDACDHCFKDHQMLKFEILTSVSVFEISEKY